MILRAFCVVELAKLAFPFTNVGQEILRQLNGFGLRVGLEDGKTIIDGHGLGAYLNHSCDPNCEVDEIKGRVWVFARRDIAPGEELLWDYNLYDDDDPAPCNCGSPKCRGTMYSREWLAKLRRKQARMKKKPEGNNGNHHP